MTESYVVWTVLSYNYDKKFLDAWLHRHFGPDSFTLGETMELIDQNNDSSMLTGLYVSFNNNEDAILFKLMWDNIGEYKNE